SEPENVARELDDRVLESASGADERNAALARVADRLQGAGHAAIRTRRRDPHAVVTREARLGRGTNRLGADPFERQAEVTQRAIGHEMRGVLRLEVPDHPDDVAHGHAILPG